MRAVVVTCFESNEKRAHLAYETLKGKGYEFAEKDPKHFHGINKFNIETGESPQSKESFSSVFG